jgi:hypothetical protein
MKLAQEKKEITKKQVYELRRRQDEKTCIYLTAIPIQ